MTMSDLLILYLVAGLACAVAVVRRRGALTREALLSAGITLLLWPLWAPFVLLKAAPPPRRGAEHEPEAPRERHPAEERIEKALQGALEATEQAGLEQLLSARDAEQIQAVATAVADRLAALALQLSRYSEGGSDEGRPSAAPPEHQVSTGAIAAARRRARCLDRLRRLRDRDLGALDELAELCEALRAELMLAQYGAAEDLAELKHELWARLEGLTAISGVDEIAATA